MVQACATGASGVALVISLVLLEETFVGVMAARRRILTMMGGGTADIVDLCS